MRNLVRNRRPLYRSAITGTEPVVDEYGNETLEERVVYGEPLKIYCNFSANVGREAVEVFGAQTEYSRTVSWAGEDCPFSEGDLVWIGVEPTEAHNYTVARVADSKNGYLVALREVTKRG